MAEGFGIWLRVLVLGFRDLAYGFGFRVFGFDLGFCDFALFFWVSGLDLRFWFKCFGIWLLVLG